MPLDSGADNIKVVFDHQIFSVQEYGGISRYFYNLVKHLADEPGVYAKIIAPLYKTKFLEKLPRSQFRGIRIPRIPRTGRLFQMASRWLARDAVARFRPDIIHETYYQRRPPVLKGVPCVITVYDMINERFPSMFPEKDHTIERKRNAVVRADHVVCISEQTRSDLLDLVKVSPTKVSVVHLGVCALSDPPWESDPRFWRPEGSPYLLYVGGRAGYKNFARLLSAYASSNWLYRNLRIICFGGGLLRSEELDLMKQFGVSRDRVIQVEGGDEQLAQYYQHAEALVYPSLYEGFGIPPIEAMSLNCPVICSQTSSLPEVVGEAGEYFDPHDTDSIRAAIERVLQSSERRDLLVREGARRHKQFSWERCAAQTAAIYRGLV